MVLLKKPEGHIDILLLHLCFDFLYRLNKLKKRKKDNHLKLHITVTILEKISLKDTN